MSLLLRIDRWLPPIAHFELNPDSCLSIVFFDKRPLTAVSVYSKSARVKKGAHGRSESNPLVRILELLVVFAGMAIGELRGMIVVVESRE